MFANYKSQYPDLSIRLSCVHCNLSFTYILLIRTTKNDLWINSWQRKQLTNPYNSADFRTSYITHMKVIFIRDNKNMTKLDSEI